MDKKRILIVDDEPDLVEFVRMRLEANDYQPLIATDGPEALEVVRSERPNLIILDILLPTLNGYEVCEKLKHDPEFARIPVLMLTAKAQENDIILAKKVGADAYISKPFEASLLLFHIKDLLAKS
jgi:two-component system alkaline phosphatase synthesis response regulator PhoP